MQDDVVRADYLGLQFPQVAMVFQDILVATNKQKSFCATYEVVVGGMLRDMARASLGQPCQSNEVACEHALRHCEAIERVQAFVCL